MPNRAPSSPGGPGYTRGSRLIRSSLAFTSLVWCFGTSACARIQTNSYSTNRVLSETSSRSNYSDWHFEASSTTSGDAVALEVQKVQYCTVTTESTGERTTTYVRKNRDVGVTVFGGIIGALGAGAVTWAFMQHADGEPFVRKNPDGTGEWTTAGGALYAGSFASFGLITAAHGTFASIDTSTTEPWEDRSSETKACREGKMVGASVELRVQGHAIAKARTDSSGRSAFACLLGALQTAEAPARVLVDGRPIEEPANWVQPAIASAHASKHDNASEVTGVNQALTLFDANLARIERERLDSVILQHGGVQVSEEDHVSIFDVTSIGWPYATTLKLLFDAEGLFIKAKWEGDYTGEHRAELLAALYERYGAPRVSRKDGALATLVWPFRDGLEVRHRFVPAERPAACPVSELTYVDPDNYEKFDAAVRQQSQGS